MCCTKMSLDKDIYGATNVKDVHTIAIRVVDGVL